MWLGCTRSAGCSGCRARADGWCMQVHVCFKCLGGGRSASPCRHAAAPAGKRRRGGMAASVHPRRARFGHQPFPSPLLPFGTQSGCRQSTLPAGRPSCATTAGGRGTRPTISFTTSAAAAPTTPAWFEASTHNTRTRFDAQRQRHGLSRRPRRAVPCCAQAGTSCSACPRSAPLSHAPPSSLSLLPRCHPHCLYLLSPLPCTLPVPSCFPPFGFPALLPAWGQPGGAPAPRACRHTAAPAAAAPPAPCSCAPAQPCPLILPRLCSCSGVPQAPDLCSACACPRCTPPPPLPAFSSACTTMNPVLHHGCTTASSPSLPSRAPVATLVVDRIAQPVPGVLPALLWQRGAVSAAGPPAGAGQPWRRLCPRHPPVCCARLVHALPWVLLWHNRRPMLQFDE